MTVFDYLQEIEAYKILEQPIFFTVITQSLRGVKYIPGNFMQDSYCYWIML
jgi:hypothetical protein